MQYNLPNADEENHVHSTHIALGSNLNDPVAKIHRALDVLEYTPNIQILKQSHIYWSQPVGPQDQPHFANQVLSLQTTLSPQALLTTLQKIENKLGKNTPYRWGPRNIDLDILLYDQLQLSSLTLSIPHTQLLHRDFVLIPLFEIAPHLILPNQLPLSQALLNCPTSSVYACQL